MLDLQRPVQLHSIIVGRVEGTRFITAYEVDANDISPEESSLWLNRTPAFCFVCDLPRFSMDGSHAVKDAYRLTNELLPTEKELRQAFGDRLYPLVWWISAVIGRPVAPSPELVALLNGSRSVESLLCPLPWFMEFSKLGSVNFSQYEVQRLLLLSELAFLAAASGTFKHWTSFSGRSPMDTLTSYGYWWSHGDLEKVGDFKGSVALQQFREKQNLPERSITQVLELLKR